MPTEKIRVIHVIARFNIGGTARYLSHLLPELEQNNLEVLLVVGRVQSGEIEDSSLANLKIVRIEKLGRKISFISDLISYFKIRKIVEDFKPDLIHSHTFKAGFLSRLMHFRIPKVHTFHGHLLTDPEFTKFRKLIIVRIERFLSNFTKSLITTGEKVALDLQAEGVGSPIQYISIPGQVRFLEAGSREKARQRLNLRDEFTILWSARLVSVKNPKLLVEIAKLMPDCKFLMAGDGIELDSIRSNAPTNLEILGFVDMKEILLAADIFLSTSLNEGVPYSLMEAQSVGLPIIAVNCGAISELVIDGVNGYLVEPLAEEIVNRIREIQMDTDTLKRIRLNIEKQKIEKNLEIDFVSKHIELYKSLLDDN